MSLEFSYPAAFVVGLLGGVHCVGMCGGIVTALTLGLPESVRNSGKISRFLLAYNVGRLSSYTLAGGLMGGVGWLAAHWAGLRQVQLGLQVFAALFMVALGLYLGGWWRGLVHIESLGGHVWRHVEPVGRRFMPVHSVSAAFVLGLLWGWLPCGLVYSVLVWSIASGGPIEGAGLMLAFGAGTLPLMMVLGAVAGRVSGWIRNENARRAAGALVLALGIYQLTVALSA
jgi:sulfite exporter TauE/SafE